MALIVVGVIFEVFCGSEALGQPIDSKSKAAVAFRNEWNKLRTERPAEYDKQKRVFVAIAELALARLGYGVGPIDGRMSPSDQAALKTYERNRGLSVTGDPLTFETITKLGEDSKSLDSFAVALPSFVLMDEFWDRGYVNVEGSWTIIGSEIASFEQTSKISCSKEKGTCTEATAKLVGDSGSKQLFLDFETYEIERWDEHEIQTKPVQAACTRLIRRINRAQKSVTGLRSTISASGLCKDVQQSDLHLVMVSGQDVWKRQNELHRKNWADLMQIEPELLRLMRSN